MTSHAIAADLRAVDWSALIADAIAAPSVHNTQPWLFVVRGDLVELWLDPARVLAVADPDGREARLSCGAALFNLRLAVRVRGHMGRVRLLPDRRQPRLLAAVQLGEPRPATPLEVALHRAIHRRHSHRRPFQRSGVPQSVRHLIMQSAAVGGAELRLIDDQRTVDRIVALVREADERQRRDPRFAAELTRWTFDGRSRRDGVPRTVDGPRPPADSLVALRKFAPAAPRPEREFEPNPLYGVLLSDGDSPIDQLRAGQALQRALLTATAHGAVACMLSQPVEVPRVRAGLRKVLTSAGYPQLVLRLGMASATRTTPRRLVHE